MFAVCVSLKIKAQDRDAFLRRMRANADASLSQEPGCHRFDVLTDPDRPDDVFLYEVYSDKAAFDAHLHTAHYAEFDAETAPMVTHKSVQTWAGVYP